MTKTAATAPTDFAALDAAYVSPTYLRTPFREFLLTRDRGLYWLRAPAGIGKSFFARGLVAKKPGRDDGIDSAIHADVRAVALHLPPGGDLLARLDAAVAESLGGTPAAGGTLADRFAPWLELAQAAGGRRLLLCIDALEQADAAELAALLPAAADLPVGVVILLTSRPAAEWPPEQLAALTAQLGEGAMVREIDLMEPTYVDMLRGFFKERTRPLLRQLMVDHLEQMMVAKSAFGPPGRDDRLTNNPVLRDTLKSDWKKLTNKYPRYTGQQLPVVPLVPLLDQFDQLWVDLIDRSEQRFDLLSPVIGKLTAGALKLEQVAALPKGDPLLAQLDALASAA